MYRRTTFLDLGKYQEELILGEDTALDINLGMKQNIAKIDKYIYLYFKHDHATTTLSKKKKSRAFMQWPRIIHSHLPFHLKNKNEKEYFEILKAKIYSSIGKMIAEQDTLEERKSLRKKLYKEIMPLRLPSALDLSIKFLVIWNSDYILKFYLYYIMPRYVTVVNLKKY